MNRMKRERMIKQGAVGMGLLKGGVWSVGITIIGAALMASLILRGTLQETAIGYAAMVVLLTASVVGSTVTVRETGSKLVFSAGLSGVVYFGILAMVNALVYKGGFEGVGATALVIVSGVGVSILMNVNRRGGKRMIKM